MLSAWLTAATAAASADSVLLRVLTINDLHGGLLPRVYSWSGGRPVGGVLALKAAIDSAAAECRCPSVRLDGGDEMQGTLVSNLVHGRSTVAALNRLGIQAAAVGNHDLDWGVDTLVSRMREAQYPWLAANVFDSVTGKRPAWSTPWRTITAGPYRIAVIGYITREAKSIIKAANVAGLSFRGGRTAIADVLAEAKRTRPDFTFIVAHAGARCDSLGCTGEIVDLARQLDSTEVQLIVSGHTHTYVNTAVNGIPIVQARSNGTAWGAADLVARDDGSRGWKVRVETAYAGGDRGDPALERLLDAYRPLVDSLADRPVAVMAAPLPRSSPDLALGRLLAETQRVAAGADVGMMNSGGIRADLPAGPVTYGQLFEVEPFQNRVLRLTIPGRTLRAVVEHTLGSGHPAAFAGLVIRSDSTRPPGRRVVDLRLGSGRAVRDGAWYTLGVSDFLASGGDGLTMLVGRPTHDTGQYDIDALVAWLRRQPQPVAVPSNGRFIPGRKHERIDPRLH
ncbi:MAG: 5'-nucleotidase C-terminal domain-containing protein [Gemmatimonadota bacterium]